MKLARRLFFQLPVILAFATIASVGCVTSPSHSSLANQYQVPAPQQYGAQPTGRRQASQASYQNPTPSFFGFGSGSC